MTEDAAPYRALLAAMGYPPIAGGAPEADDEGAEDTPSPDPGESGSDNEQTPASESDEDSTASDIDWEKRYTDLQPEYTRASQEAAQLRQIIDLARQGDPEALQFLGYEAPEDTEESDDDELSLEERLERMEAERAAEREELQREQQERELEEVEQKFYEAEFSKLDPEDDWSDEYKAFVVGAAHQLPPDEDGLPDLEAGHKALQDHFEAEFKQRVQSKRTPQAPSGASASHQPDLDDAEERREYIARRLSEAEQPAL